MSINSEQYYASNPPETSWIPVWFSDLDDYSNMTDEQYGRFVRARLHYGKTAEEPDYEATGIDKGLFRGCVRSMDAWEDKYIERVNKNRKKGEQSLGRPTAMAMTARGCNIPIDEEAQRDLKRYRKGLGEEVCYMIIRAIANNYHSPTWESAKGIFESCIAEGLTTIPLLYARLDSLIEAYEPRV